MSRRKAQFQDAVGSREEAADVANSYAHVSAQIDAIDAERATRIAAVNADCDARIGPRRDLADALFKRLKPWFETNMDAICGPKKRSAVLGACEIGVRATPAKVDFEKDGSKKPTEKTMIQRVLDHKARLPWKRMQFLRLTYALNKDVLLAALTPWSAQEKEPEERALNRAELEAIGFTTSSKDEFYIKVNAPAEDDVREVVA